MSYRVGIDVGGTFTDFALYDDAARRLHMGKVLTTPQDPSIAVLAGLDEIAGRVGIGVGQLAEAIHATTIATNTVITRTGPKTALLTTEGFRDVLQIARQKRWELYDNSVGKPVHVVPRQSIWTARERMLFDGTVHAKLNEGDVRKAARAMKAAGIKAVAICFLHSYANPAHERRAGEIVAKEAPDIMVSLSSEVSPVFREYERTSTTVLNAYVMPAVAAYVRRLDGGLAERDFKHKLFIMQSNGGVATPEIVARYPIRIIESGPAAGVLSALHYAGSAGTGNILSFDMGGTTAKLCLIENGRPSFTGQFEVDMHRLKKNSGLPINIPAIDLVEIGSGGGSIARVEMGAIAVGPESASSVPGPICYGRGGTEPTVTDADLVLGYLNPNYFLGGDMRLDLEGARRGIERAVAKPLGIDVVAAAWGIYEVVTSHMAQAARVVSVGKGKDPRQFAFIPFGGAGPVHGARLARMLGCTRIVFPHGAGVESAIGLLMAEPAFDLARTRITRVAADAVETMNEIFRGLEADGKAQLEACGMRNIRFQRSADMRFAGQGYEINVLLPGGAYGAGSVEMLKDAFFAAYASTYGDRAFDRNDPVEIVQFRVAASSPVAEMAIGGAPPGGSDGRAALKGSRPVYFPESNGYVDCPVYDRYKLKAEDRFAGPAIVEERESTAVILPHSRARIDAAGNIVVDLENA
jgi:N-methylhydantoinase A